MVMMTVMTVMMTVMTVMIKVILLIAPNLIERNFHSGALSIEKGRFRRFLTRRSGPTDRRTDGRTDRPSYRDARTHLKMSEIARKRTDLQIIRLSRSTLARSADAVFLTDVSPNMPTMTAHNKK